MGCNDNLNIIVLLNLICMIATLIFTILIYTKMYIKNCPSKDGFQNKYTESDLQRDWSALNCPFTLPDNQKRWALTYGNRQDEDAKQKVLTYLSDYANKRNCKNGQIVNINIPNNELSELQTLWNNTKCSSAFPMMYVQSLYNNKLRYPAVKSNFIRYISYMTINLTDNSEPKESLTQSFNKCYGLNWSNNDELKNKYNILNNKT